MIRVGDLEVTYTSRGLPRYALEIWHDGLNKYQVIKGDSQYVVKQKAEAKLNQWVDQWERKEAQVEKAAERENRRAAIEDAKLEADERTAEATEAIAELESILAATLEVDDTVDWDNLKDRKDYDVPKPKKPVAPYAPLPPDIRREPYPSDLRYQPELSIIDTLWRSRRERKEQEAAARYRQDHKRWLEEKEAEMALYDAKVHAREEQLRELEEEHRTSLQEWDLMRARYLEDRQVTNDAIDEKKKKYLEKDYEAILDYCDLVLSKSSYPDFFPQEYELEYIPDTGILIVDYQLPPKVNRPGFAGDSNI